MSKERFAELTTPEGKTLSLPIVKSTQGINGIDITTLKNEGGYIVYDNGFANTAPCTSKITFVDGENGKLYIRGYDMEDLAEKCTFTEVAHLLVHGTLPTQRESRRFSNYLNKHSMIHENMQYFFQGYPPDSHP
ncbi:MAG: citrate/2-methylcitrate synthase, partial [Chitinivibrionales bacterium]